MSATQPKTLYISDLDGTLLGEDSRVSPKSAAILNALTANGVLFTVATARTPATVVPLLQELNNLQPAIVMTGAAMWDHANSRFFNPHFLPEKEVEEALRICARHNVVPFIYVMAPDGSTLDVYHNRRVLNPAEAAFYEERSNLKLKRFHLGEAAPARSRTHTILFYAMGPREGIECAAADLKASSDCTVQCYPDIFNPLIYNLEVFPPGVTKAQAVLALKESIGADRVVVFGDNLNDLPMLEAADLAVAVENAFDPVKEKADIVIEPNYTDSVARFVARDAGLEHLSRL